MINSLNILVHLPLIKINFPANIQIFMSYFMGISNFDFLPTEFISEQLLEFTPTDPLSDKFEEVDIFSKAYFFSIHLTFYVTKVLIL